MNKSKIGQHFTTKNSASTAAQKQALQMRTQYLLPQVTQALSALAYSDIMHQRISYQTDAGLHQGLTQAWHPQFGLVMIKWQSAVDADKPNTGLQREVEVLKALQPPNRANTKIAPPLLAYESLSTNNFPPKILNANQQLMLLVMPYYLQGSLAGHIKQPLSAYQKHQLIVSSAELITNLHQAGFLHNDIKPSNFLLQEDLTLILTDFALAEQIDSRDHHNNKKANVDSNAGTPAYLAPERWQGQGAAVQSDIYAFGVMMYEVLVGKRPFAVDSKTNEQLREWASQHCQQPVQELPIQYAEYQAIIDKALAKLVERRYQTMKDVLEDLEKLKIEC